MLLTIPSHLHLARVPARETKGIVYFEESNRIERHLVSREPFNSNHRRIFPLTTTSSFISHPPLRFETSIEWPCEYPRSVISKTPLCPNRSTRPTVPTQHLQPANKTIGEATGRWTSRPVRLGISGQPLIDCRFSRCCDLVLRPFAHTLYIVSGVDVTRSLLLDRTEGNMSPGNSDLLLPIFLFVIEELTLHFN